MYRERDTEIQKGERERGNLLGLGDSSIFQAEILKGDFAENSLDWRYTSKREVPFLWTGDTDTDFNLFLNGFVFVALT